MVRLLVVLTIFLVFYKCNALSEGYSCRLETGARGVCRRHVGEISRQKCEEYSKYVYQLIKPPVLAAGLINVSTCAQTSIPLVAGGKNANPYEFPHMALLGYGPDYNIKWQCGGSLISDRYVLTAAHCSKDRFLGDVNKVRLGELDYSRNNEDAEPVDFGVKQVIVHPERKLPMRYHDIALVKLDGTVTFNKYIRPLCLHTTYEIPSNNDESSNPRFTVSGWGTTGDDTNEPSPQLQHTAVDYYANKRCQQKYPTNKKYLSRSIDDETQICAIGLFGNDTCPGDSGGPLQIYLKEPNCMYGIVGVTSFGKSQCGIVGVPAVYTRVSYYVKWIEDIVWPQ